MKKTLLLICIAIAVMVNVNANNIAVANVSLSDQVAASHYCNVKFDLSWDNSWRTTSVPNNWDAAWIFVKYRVSGGVWHHATLSALAIDHTPATGSSITPSTDGMGTFIYRSANGSGTNTWTNLKLRWNYGTNGVADDALLDIRVFAIEMVYVPAEPFYIGDGNGTSESSYAFHSGTTNSAVQITSALTNNIRCDGGSYEDTQISSNGIGIDGDAGIDKNNDGVVDNPGYPTGYSAYYIMKYEVSQEQFAEFLNTLTRAQQDQRVQADISTTNPSNRFVVTNQAVVYARQGIRCDATLPATGPITVYCDLDADGTYNEANDGQNVPCNYLTWMDHAAYADWAGLRPMTELEFEKACRGVNPPVYGEYAWGTTNINTTTYTVVNSGYATETYSNLSTTLGNAAIGSTSVPIGRCGIFAASSTNHTRQETGAGYYGIMEMTGNVSEYTVHIGSNAGRSFTGLHGNGELNTAGDADVDYWPGINGNTTLSAANTTYGGVTGITAAAGSGVRGESSAQSNLNDLMMSSRLSAGYTTSYASHGQNRGSRSARTAP